MGAGLPQARTSAAEARGAAQVLSVGVLPPPAALLPGPLSTGRLARSGRGLGPVGAHGAGGGLISHIPSHGGSKAVRDRNAECPLAEPQGLSKSKAALRGDRPGWGWWLRHSEVGAGHTLVGWRAAGHPVPSWVGSLWGHTAPTLTLPLPATVSEWGTAPSPGAAWEEGDSDGGSLRAQRGCLALGIPGCTGGQAT